MSNTPAVSLSLSDSDSESDAVSTAYLERLVAQALHDLNGARRDADEFGAERAERRMNAFLDKLCARQASAVS